MIFTRRQAAIVVEIVSEAARLDILPRFSGALANAVREKTSAFDIVTEADEAAEQRISERLRSAFPGAAIVGEEAAARDAGLLSRIATAELAFIIDPIDGTKNYASGLPLFGTMVAAIHDPLLQQTALALRGEGSWSQSADRAETALKVAAPVPVDRMQAVAGTNFLPEPLRAAVARNLSRLGMNFWLRCSAHEYRLAAAGHCHLLVYNKLMPWDHAAGWLLHREAGGHSAHFDGTPYLPSHTTGGLICATDAESWRLARDALFEGAELR
jgi:fructose-1,6-bisphosphatase/inositol monophosphatase family enzyme